MTIYEVSREFPEVSEKLTAVWEASVRATHAFLSDAEVLQIKAYVPEALAGVEHLLVAEQPTGVPVGFLGIQGQRLEMLFLDPAVRGTGLGRRLLTIAIKQYGVRELTVNEQNPQAVGFYEHMGFRTYRRTEQDEQSGPYPLCYMRLAP